MFPYAEWLILDSINVFDLLLSRYIRWLTLEEWERLRGNWPYMDVAVGAIDGTSHEIYKPKEHQEMYYSGHRKFHCLHSQVIIDNTGMIRHVESGFYGHQNDAQHYRLMTRIPDELPFPHTCFLLGDKIYPNGFPILSPYSHYSWETTDAVADDLIGITENTGHSLSTQ